MRGPFNIPMRQSYTFAMFPKVYLHLCTRARVFVWVFMLCATSTTCLNTGALFCLGPDNSRGVVLVEPLYRRHVQRVLSLIVSRRPISTTDHGVLWEGNRDTTPFTRHIFLVFRRVRLNRRIRFSLWTKKIPGRLTWRKIASFRWETTKFWCLSFRWDQLSVLYDYTSDDNGVATFINIYCVP